MIGAGSGPAGGGPPARSGAAGACVVITALPDRCAGTDHGRRLPLAVSRMPGESRLVGPRNLGLTLRGSRS